MTVSASIYTARHTFENKALALEFISDYMIDYNPKGYFTECTLLYEGLKDEWVVLIERAWSCD